MRCIDLQAHRSDCSHCLSVHHLGSLLDAKVNSIGNRSSAHLVFISPPFKLCHQLFGDFRMA